MTAHPGSAPATPSSKKPSSRGVTPGGYLPAQIALHWTVVALVASQYLLSDGIEEVWDRVRVGLAYELDPLAFAHIAGGVVILVLVAWRLVLRLRHGAPPPPEREHPALRILAAVAHVAFYGLLVALPMTGLLAWFADFGPAIGLHKLLKTALLALIGLHVAAALLHHFVLKTDVLRRMLQPAH